MTKSRRTASASPAQRITAAIIEKLEQGTRPWVKPWRGVPASRPLRSCGTPYRGMNTFWLWMVADGCGYPTFPADWLLLGWPLDQIMIKGRLDLQSFEVLPDNGSDHRALLAHFCAP